MISASFNVGKGDALALARHYYSRSPTVRKARLWGHLSVPVLMTLLAALIFYRDPSDSALAIPLLIVAAIWALLYPRYHSWYLLQTVEKMFKECSYQKAFGAYRVTLNDDGIASSSPIGEGKYSWSAVDRVSLTPDHLLIFLAGPQGYPIDRTQVPDTTIQQMKTFAEKRIPRTEPGAPPNAGPADAPPASVS